MKLAVSGARPVVGLAMLLLGAYLATTSGEIRLIDARVRFETTRALYERGTIELDDPSGPKYSRYDPAHSLLMLPAYAIARLAGGGDSATEFAAVSISALFAVGACLLLLPVLEMAGISRTGAIGSALVLGLASNFLPYVDDAFYEPLQAFCVVGMLWGLQVHERRQRPVWLLVSGLFLSLAGLTKISNLTLLVVPAGYLLVLSLKPPAPEEPESRTTGEGLRGDIDMALVVRGMLAVFVGLLPGLVLLGLHNYVRYGSILTTLPGGTSGMGQFQTPLLQGLYVVFFSPGKGLLWYAPVVLLSLWGVPHMWRRNAALTVAALAGIVVITIPHAMLDAPGGSCWGQRYFVPAMPLFAFLWAPVFERLVGRQLRPAVAGLVVALCAASLGVQLLGTSVHFDRWYADQVTLGRDSIIDASLHWDQFHIVRQVGYTAEAWRVFADRTRGVPTATGEELPHFWWALAIAKDANPVTVWLGLALLCAMILAGVRLLFR